MSTRELISKLLSSLSSKQHLQHPPYNFNKRLELVSLSWFYTSDLKIWSGVSTRVPTKLSFTQCKKQQMTAAQQLQTYTLHHQGHSTLFSWSLPLKELFLLCPLLKGHTGNLRNCSVLTRPPQLQKRSGTQYCLLCNQTDPSSEDKQTEIPPLL